MSRTLPAVVAILAAAGAAHAQSTFRGIGIPEGASGSIGYAISANGGAVTGIAEDSLGFLRAIKWSGGATPVLLPYLAGDNGCEGEAISADGTIIVGRSIDQQLDESQACRWTGTAPAGLGDLPGSDFYSTAWACSADGQTVVGTGASSLYFSEAFRRSPAGVFTGLGVLPGGDWSEGYGVSADGSVVVGSSTDVDFTFQAYRWTASTGMVGLGFPPDCYESHAYAVSPDGSAIVGEGITFGEDGDYFRGFRWTAAGGIQVLPFCSGCTGTSAFAASTGGTVVVGNMYNDLNQARALVWDATNGSRLLQDVLEATGAAPALAGWTLVTASGISPDARYITGYGVNPAGFVEGYVAFVPSLGGGPAPCYANCDASVAAPVLNVQDFSCFLQRFAAGDAYANCDASTAPPALNVQDFTCFLQKFAAGCP